MTGLLDFPFYDSCLQIVLHFRNSILVLGLSLSAIISKHKMNP